MCLGNRNCRRGLHIIKINSRVRFVRLVRVNEYGGVKCQLLLMYWKIIAASAAERPAAAVNLNGKMNGNGTLRLYTGKFENCTNAVPNISVIEAEVFVGSKYIYCDLVKFVI